MPGGSSKQTIGYKYFLGMHMVLCHGPADHLCAVYVDGRKAWGDDESPSAGGAITIDKPELFGGEKREGGISGDIDVLMGDSAQAVNDYLVSQLGADTPAYRGVVSVILNQCYMGNNPYIKPWSFCMQRIHVKTDGSDQWYDAKSAIAATPSETAYSDGLASLGLTYAQTSSTAALTWPFATSSGDTGKMFAYYSYLPSPNIGTVLGGSPSAAGYNGGSPSGWSWDADISLPFLCGGALGGCLNIKENGTGMVIKRQRHTAGSFDWGDYAFSSVLSGFNGTGYMDGILAQNPQKRWNIYCTGKTFPNTYVDTTVRISSTSDGSGGYTQSLSISIGGTTVATLGLGAIGNRWTLFNVAVQSGAPYAGTYDGHHHTLISSTITVGVYDAVTMDELGVLVGTGTKDHVSNGALLSAPAASNTFYTTADLFRSVQLSVATMSGGIWSYDTQTHEEAIDQLSSLYDTGCFIAGECADINPAHAIRECLTDTVWGMGYQDADIDDTSFAAAADDLYSEGMGISLLWDRSSPLEDFIGEILRHIDGVLYVNRHTGKFTLKLVREDWTISGLTSLDESSISEVSNFRRPTVGELINSVTVNYYDEEATNEVGTVSVHDQALVQIQGAVIGSVIEYAGFTREDIALRVAQRDLKALSIPLISCDITASRIAADLNVGDAFLLNWPDLGVADTVMRVESISFGDGRDNAIKIGAVQDVFGVASQGESITSGGSGLWIDPGSLLPEAAYPRIAIEAPYYTLAQDRSQLSLDAVLDDESDAGFLLAASGRQNNEINADLSVDSAAGYAVAATLDFCPHALLDGAIGHTDTTIYITGGIDLDDIITGSVAQIGNELVRVDGTGTDSTGVYVTVGRGVLDTVPAEHTPDSSGIPVVFWGSQYASDETQYTASDSLDIKMLTVRGSNILPIGDAPVDSVVMNSRAIRPYPPGDLQVDGQSYPASLSTGTPVYTWENRDRLQQTSGAILDHTAGGVGPEAGTTYLVESDAILADTSVVENWLSVNVGSATSYAFDSSTGTPPGTTEEIIVRVTAIRDGYESWQSPSVRTVWP